MLMLCSCYVADFWWPGERVGWLRVMEGYRNAVFLEGLEGLEGEGEGVGWKGG